MSPPLHALVCRCGATSPLRAGRSVAILEAARDGWRRINSEWLCVECAARAMDTARLGMATQEAGHEPAEG